MFVDEHHLGISRQVEHLVDNAAIGPRKTWCFAGLAAGFTAEAQGHAARDAIFAVTAERRQAGDDRVANLNGAYFAADGFDNTRRFMPGNGRQRVRVGAFDKVQVAMAKAAGRGADQHLMRPGVRYVDLFNLKRFARFDQYRCFHRATPISPLDMLLDGLAPYLPSSMRAIARAWTSSGPSARRSVR